MLENPIRRRIIERLSQEPNYTLQLAKELGLGQQLVAKHLKVMEDSGLLKSSIESSPSGPRRRIFKLNRSLSITLDVAPHLFNQEIVSFEVEPERSQMSKDLASLVERRNEIAGCLEEEDRMNTCAEILSDIDQKLELLAEERLLLLFIRNSVMREASRAIQQIDDSEARRVMHLAVQEHNKNAKSLAEALNLREERVRKLIQKLKEFETSFFE